MKRKVLPTLAVVLAGITCNTYATETQFTDWWHTDHNGSRIFIESEDKTAVLTIGDKSDITLITKNASECTDKPQAFSFWDKTIVNYMDCDIAPDGSVVYSHRPSDKQGYLVSDKIFVKMKEMSSVSVIHTSNIRGWWGYADGPEFSLMGFTAAMKYQAENQPPHSGPGFQQAAKLDVKMLDAFSAPLRLTQGVDDWLLKDEPKTTSWDFESEKSTAEPKLASAVNMPSVSESDRKLLVYIAERQLEKEWTRSPPICTNVQDEKIGETNFGRITKTGSTGKLSDPLPAIVVSVDYTCINGYTRTKTKEQHWMTMALDEDFDMIRCLYVWGGKEQAYGTAKSCGFIEE